MDVLTAILLGIIEGITEFLPISSTGHLILANQWLHLPANLEKTFDIFIQLGAVLAIVVIYWRRILDLLLRLPREPQVQRLAIALALAFLPAAVIGVLFGNVIQAELFNPITVALALIIGGVVMWLVDARERSGGVQKLEEVTPTSGLIVGAWQTLSLVPGTSRSASSIIGGMFAGLDRKTAVEFSFFLAIPTMFAATLYALAKNASGLRGSDWLLLGIGFVTAFVTALIVVRLFLSYVSTNTLRPFAIYRILLGALVLVLFLTGIVK